MHKEISIKGIPVASFSSMQEMIDTAIFSLSGVLPGVAVAINPEKIITALDDKETMDALLGATLRYADGIGVSYVMGKKQQSKVTRIPGCDLWQEVMRNAASKNIPVFLVGAKPHVIAATKQKLESWGVNVVGCQDGYFSEQQQVIEQIKQSGAKIVTVALGSPKQEKFIFDCKKSLPDAFYMGVGGTYDVFTGNIKRAPVLWQKLHLEWFYRLASQPSRLFRQTKLIRYVYYYFTKKL